MMDALINAFVDEIKQKSTGFAEETDRPLYDTSTDSDGISHIFSLCKKNIFCGPCPIKIFQILAPNNHYRNIVNLYYT